MLLVVANVLLLMCVVAGPVALGIIIAIYGLSVPRRAPLYGAAMTGSPGPDAWIPPHGLPVAVPAMPPSLYDAPALEPAIGPVAPPPMTHPPVATAMPEPIHAPSAVLVAVPVAPRTEPIHAPPMPPQPSVTMPSPRAASIPPAVPAISAAHVPKAPSLPPVPPPAPARRPAPVTPPRSAVIKPGAVPTMEMPAAARVVSLPAPRATTAGSKNAASPVRVIAAPETGKAARLLSDLPPLPPGRPSSESLSAPIRPSALTSREIPASSPRAQAPRRARGTAAAPPKRHDSEPTTCTISASSTLDEHTVVDDATHSSAPPWEARARYSS